MIILTKNQDFTLSLEDAFFEKPRGRWREGGVEIELKVLHTTEMNL